MWVLPVSASRDRRLPIDFLEPSRIEREVLYLSCDFPSHVEFGNVDSLIMILNVLNFLFILTALPPTRRGPLVPPDDVQPIDD